MKRIFAIIMAICLMVSVFSVTSITAFAEEALPEPAAGTVLRVTAIKGDDTVLIGDYNNFEDGWNAAMAIAGDEDEMDDNGYARIIVDVCVDWKADGDKFGSGDGFSSGAIEFPENAKVTLDLKGHTINRGLADDIDDGGVMFINDDADVIIKDGTITGGYSNSEGGALYIEGAKVTLNNVNIVGNKVYNDDGAGIALYDGATLTMTGGSFQNNILSGSTFDCYGGAIYINDSIATFNGVTFKNNVTKNDNHYGAAIYADNGNVTINECIFDGNGIEDEANTILAAISIIHATDSSITMEKSSLTNNGDLHYEGNQNAYRNVSSLFYLDGSSLIMEGCGVTENTLGHLIQTTDNSKFFISGTNITDNNATVLKSDGHSIDSYFNVCTFGNNTTSSYMGNKYSFLKYSFAFNSPVTFYNCDMGNSTYSNPASIKLINQNLDSGIVLTISGQKADGTVVKIEDHHSFETGWAAAMRLATDSYWMFMNLYEYVVVDMHTDWIASNGRFTNAMINGIGFNSDTIHVSEGACLILNMNGYKIDRGLTTDEANGEVLYIAYGADITINDGTITGGYSNNGAGGIHISGDAKVTLNNVNVVGNKVEDDDGGGIAVYGGATLVMNGGSVSNNVVECFAAFVTLCGGGINVEDSTVILTDVTIENNTYKPEGFFSDNGLDGAAIAADDAMVIMKNCSVKNNGIPNEEDEEYSNSIICARDSTLVIEDTNFSGNGVRHSWRVSTSEIYYGSSVICTYRSSLDMSGGNFTDNNTVFLLRISDTVVNVEGVDFTGNNSLSLNAYLYSVGTGTFTNCKFSKGPEYVYFKGNLLYKSRKFEDDFIFNDSRASLKFVDCDFGDATFSSKRIATFVGCDVSNDVGSIFGEGSLTMIVAILALVTSAAAIGISISSKKKTVVATANNKAESDDEE